ncbi:hypothetical protein [Pedobacter sp. R-06]|uniref:hypothetical protein n=1 Tax=Pedobacter sp. R-06 TaxID=3404051 RepID=UPI003CFA869F
MKHFKILFILTCFSFSIAWSQESKSQQSAYISHNRTVEQVKENEKSIVRLSEGTGAGVAWVKDLLFSEGTIEFNAKGRDLMQKSFIGIAFHGIDNETYESVYFRPFNFQSADSVRKIHAVQYSFEPKFGFQQLRNTHKDKYESGINSPTVKATDWFHIKVEVKENKVKVFLNGGQVPCLEVTTLNPNPTGKKIGFWVGNNSNGDFANLRISK